MSWLTKIKQYIKKLWAKINPDNDPVDPVTPPAEPPAEPPETPVAGDNTFLWKPVSESRGGRACAITPACLTVKSITVNGESPAEYAGRANGNRQHYFLRKTGSAYGHNVKVIATLTDGSTRTWIIPDGSQRKAFAS